jgi:hypothetical protein
VADGARRADVRPRQAGDPDFTPARFVSHHEIQPCCAAPIFFIMKVYVAHREFNMLSGCF